MPFTLVQLETFRALAQTAHFTRTAERLHLTQPAVTQQVRALERHFGVKLVDLVGRRGALTDAGTFLASRAELLLENVAALERDMREFADVRAGDLRIGATLTIGAYVLPDLVARYRARFPAIALHVLVENTQAMALAVKAGRVSLALVEGPLDDDDLAIESFATDELVLVVGNEHPLAARRRKRIVAADLREHPFVFREEGSGTRDFVEAALRSRGISPRVVLALPSGEGIVRAVELGIGVTIVSRLVVETALREKRLTRLAIDDLDLRRTFRTVRLRRRTPSPAALAFARLLHDKD